MGLELGALALLEHDPLEAALEIVGEDHVPQPDLRVRDAEDAGELAARPNDRDGPAAVVDRAPLLLGLVDEAPEIVGELALALLGSAGRHLHRHGVEPRLVSFAEGAQKRLELFRRGHGCSYWIT